MREAIAMRGMDSLGAKSGKEAADNAEVELMGGDAPFDPHMSMHWHFTNAALKAGGLYLVAENPDDPEGHFCPICEFEKHATNFVAKDAVGHIADQMLAYCRKEGLVGLPS